MPNITTPFLGTDGAKRDNFNAKIADINAHGNDTTAHTTQADKDKIEIAAQSATIVGQHTQQLENLIIEAGSVALINTKQYPFNDSALTVTLATLRENLNYMVYAELVSSNGSVEAVEVYDRQLNGFKIKFIGSAASSQINYFVSGGMQS